MLPDTPDSDPTTFTYRQAFFETHGQKYIQYDIWTNLCASDRSKAKATSGRTLETSGWLELTKTSDGKMSMQYYTIYAYLCHIYAICLDMPERITIFGWNSVDVTRRRRHAPGQAGGGASRITWLGAETTSSDGRSCDILHTDIQYTWIMVH